MTQSHLFVSSCSRRQLARRRVGRRSLSGTRLALVLVAAAVAVALITGYGGL
jgi:hypothetical protein